MAKEKKEEQKIPLENQPEQIIEVEVERLREFKGHPFKVTDDLEMESLKKSISKYGILTPLIVRPILDGVYEIVSGHRRKHAAESLGCANADSVTTLVMKIQNIGNDCCAHLSHCEDEVDEDLRMMLKEIIDYANALEVLGDRMRDDTGDVANQIDVMSFDVDEE